MRKYITFVFEIVKREEISKYFQLYNLNEKGNHYNDPCLFPFECITGKYHYLGGKRFLSMLFSIKF